jgi:hypothetical protein
VIDAWYYHWRFRYSQKPRKDKWRIENWYSSNLTPSSVHWKGAALSANEIFSTLSADNWPIKGSKSSIKWGR